MTAGVSRTIETELHNIARCPLGLRLCADRSEGPAGPAARASVFTLGRLTGSISRVATRLSNELVRRYLRDMGPNGLLEVISRVPHEIGRTLSRDEIADFGIDTREFQETRWSSHGVAVTDKIVAATAFGPEIRG